jgi:hypothetical protein
MQPTHVYEVRPRKDKGGFDLISDALPFGRLWYTKPDDAIDYARFFSRSHDAVIRVYDEAGKVIETHEQAGEIKDWRSFYSHQVALLAKTKRSRGKEEHGRGPSTLG